MKTTLELLDDLLRRVRIRAVHERRKLKEMVATLLEQGLASSSWKDRASLPEPVKLRKKGTLRAAEIERAIRTGRS